MKLTILGSGTMVPTKQRYPSGYLLEHGSTKLLLDCGFLSIARILDQEIDLQDIAVIAITHFHTDHIGHLLPFVHARFVDDVYSRRDNHRPLTIFGPKSARQRFAKMRQISWPEPEEDYPVVFHEGRVSQSIDDLTIQTFPTKHVSWFASVGYRISANGQTLVYTGDIAPEQENSFDNSVKGASLLLTESAALDNSSKTHITPEVAVETAKRLHIKKLVITHIPTHTESHIQAVANQHPDLVTIAKDGMSFEI
jgi:ribonuclease BN (tRNA processing enzyme)